MDKLGLVVKVLNESVEIREWYRKEVGVDFEKFTVANIREYGMDGMGYIADMILSDGVTYGIISGDDLEI